jgi:hypothetical protein
MPLSRDLIDRLPPVEGILNYLAPMPEKPMNLAYDPAPGVPRSTGVPEPHRMTIYDARPVAAQLSLDSEGLALDPSPRPGRPSVSSRGTRTILKELETRRLKNRGHLARNRKFESISLHRRVNREPDLSRPSHR